ncbi:MAG: DNA-binding protein WhiA [Faecalibacterium sp.]|nr:DNA-binding protein WhiA [Ruminococcus sp.]MCM1391611.1 DNA-binding protein WhiA [Ruminococcus sp.]MCM1485023.1 DNA-binding protein WhiA [Faecalibacterium sp.]
MSFSSTVKEELVKIENIAPCCLHAMAYGMLLFGRSFNLKSVSLMTEHECVAKQYALMIEKTTNVAPHFLVSDAGKYSISVDNPEEAVQVLSEFFVSGNEAFMRINRGNLLNECSSDATEDFNCCNGAFLRGAFLSCGTISDPNKGYHLEFVVPFRTLSFDLMKMLTDYGLKAKHMVRRGANVIYVKDSESIEDLLNIMGAQMAAFEIMNIKIYKDIRNVSNRITNFNCANISRTVSAAYDQIEKIEKLIKNGTFESLDDELRAFARVRIDNPDASLRELGEMFDPPLSRSAVNHRIKKILSFYDNQNKIKSDAQQDTDGGI